MTRLEKCEILKEKGFTYDPETGKIYGVYGKEITAKNNYGYIAIGGRTHFKNILYGHHFAWYMIYGNVDFEMLDHINRDRSDNRISNLRSVTRQQNMYNTGAKGYCWVKNISKWKSQIQVNKKLVCVGYFNTKEEARNAYLDAKEKYHII